MNGWTRMTIILSGGAIAGALAKEYALALCAVLLIGVAYGVQRQISSAKEAKEATIDEK